MVRKFVSFLAFIGIVCVDCSKWIKLPAIEKIANTEMQNESVKTLVELSDEMFLVQNRNVPFEKVFYNASYNISELENKSKVDINKSFDKFNPALHINSNSESLNQTIENSIKSSENVGSYDIKRLSSFVKRLQTNIFNNIPTTLKEKIKFLRNMHDNILMNIGKPIHISSHEQLNLSKSKQVIGWIHCGRMVLLVEE